MHEIFFLFELYNLSLQMNRTIINTSIVNMTMVQHCIVIVLCEHNKTIGKSCLYHSVWSVQMYMIFFTQPWVEYEVGLCWDGENYKDHRSA